MPIVDDPPENMDVLLFSRKFVLLRQEKVKREIVQPD